MSPRASRSNRQSERMAWIGVRSGVNDATSYSLSQCSTISGICRIKKKALNTRDTRIACDAKLAIRVNWNKTIADTFDTSRFPRRQLINLIISECFFSSHSLSLSLSSFTSLTILFLLFSVSFLHKPPPPRWKRKYQNKNQSSKRIEKLLSRLTCVCLWHWKIFKTKQK